MTEQNLQCFSFDSKKLLASKQFDNACRLEVGEDKSIKQIINIKAMAKIISSEKVNNNISYVGEIKYHVVYLDNENNLLSLLTTNSFQERIDASEDKYFIVPTVVDSLVTGFSSTEIAVNSCIKIDVYGVVENKVDYVTQLDSSFVTSDKKYEYQKVVNTVTNTFNEVAEQEIPKKINEVLYFTAVPLLEKVVAGIDTITLEGKVDFNAYLIKDGQITLEKKCVDFKQEVASLSTMPNHQIDVNLHLNDARVSASVSDIEEKTNLIYAFELSLYLVSFSRETVNVIEDAFSLKNEIVTSRECLQKDTLEGREVNNFNLSYNIPLQYEITEALYVSKVNTNLVDTLQTDSGIVVNGNANVEMVCRNENGDVVNVDGLIPFSLQLPDTHFLNDFSVKVNFLSLKSRGTGVEVNYDIIIENNYYSSEYVSAIGSIEETDEKPIGNCAIKVYVVGQDEDLFSVAKTLSIRPETILQQNPAVADGLFKGMRLIVYYPLEVNF